jgi:hypothetical protein
MDEISEVDHIQPLVQQGTNEPANRRLFSATARDTPVCALAALLAGSDSHALTSDSDWEQRQTSLKHTPDRVL